MIAAIALLCVSESGVAEPVTLRSVLLLPYVPLAALLVLGIVVGIATKASAGVDRVLGSGRSG